MIDGLIVDCFAGGGGASLGIEQALGRPVDIAINHNPDAIAMHAANHPHTEHHPADVWKVNPRQVTRGRKVGLLWCSPDCRHFSRAKGGKPVSKKIRGLAYVAIHWAQQVQPQIIMLENVREFQEWGPLVPKLDSSGKPILDLHGKPQLVPDPTRKGQSFRRFVGRLRNLGYAVEWRDLDAASFGAPTHRKRLFMIARRDGEPIRWPEHPHGPKGDLFLKPYRMAAECIDWSLPCPSIFERKRPLAENTMKRIANGLRRYVLECAEPFIVTCNHQGDHFRGQGLTEPFKTVTGARDAHGLVVPVVAPFVAGVGGRMGQSPEKGVNSPLNACTAKADKALIAPYLVRIGQTGGNGNYVSDVTDGLGTVVSKNEHIVIAPILVGAGGPEYSGKPKPLIKPMNTQLQENHNHLVAAFLTKLYGTCEHGQEVGKPMPTVTGQGNHIAEVRAFLVKYYSAAKRFTCQRMQRFCQVLTVRFGLVTVMIGCEPYVIVDIGMRMLTPRELARAQGFPDSYVLTGTKSNQVARIGNSVCPCVPTAIIRANFTEKKVRKTA